MTEKDKELFHEPSDEAFACCRLELYHPTLEGDTTSTRAWQELRAVRRTIGQAVQRGFGDVVVHIRNLRAAGKTRFPTQAEKTNAKLGVPVPLDCYEDADLKPIAEFLASALKSTGLSEYVYSSVARRISLAELSGERLKNLLRGEAAYPVMHRLGIMMRARNWKIWTEDRVANGKTYLEPTIEIAALRPGLGKMRLACKRLHGPKLERSKALLSALSSMETRTQDDSGWSKGALTIVPVRRPGQPEKWFILIPYSAPRAAAAGAEGPVVAIHRGIANMLTAATSGGTVSQFPGRDVIALKFQMHARRRAVARDLSAMPHRGRGARQHFKALARLADAEARATETNLWRAARWAQTFVEKTGAKLLLLDDFTSFDPDRPAPPFEPYVRTFPLAQLKLRIIDAVTRRAGVPVQEVTSKYISQRCPECGHTDEKNIAKLPVIRGIDVEKGSFKCGKCRFSADIDVVAVRNLLDYYGARPSAESVSV